MYSKKNQNCSHENVNLLNCKLLMPAFCHLERECLASVKVLIIIKKQRDRHPWGRRSGDSCFEWKSQQGSCSRYEFPVNAIWARVPSLHQLGEVREKKVTTYVFKQFDTSFGCRSPSEPFSKSQNFKCDLAQAGQWVALQPNSWCLWSDGLQFETRP